MTKEAHTTTDIPVRDRLLDAAERVVSREGVGNLTLDAVAREAGVSKGGLLYHFPNKATLVVAVVDRLASQCDADHARHQNACGQRVGSFVRAYLEARTEPLTPEELPIHSALLVAAGMNPQFMEPFAKRMAGWQGQLESDGIDPVTATIVRLACDGLCLGRLLGLPGPAPELQQQVVDRLRKMVAQEQDKQNKQQATEGQGS